MHQNDEDELGSLPSFTEWRKSELRFGQRWHTTATERERELVSAIVAQYKERAGVIRQDHKHEDALLRQFHDELFDLRAARAPVHRVPDDVLSLIFETNAEALFAGDMDGYDTLDVAFQVACSRVCQRWRAAALRTPYLWSTFAIYDERSLNYADACITHRSVSSFAIYFSRCCENSFPGYPFSDAEESLWPFLSRHADKLTSLRLDMCDEMIRTFFSDTEKLLVGLERLSVLTERFACCSQETPIRWMGEELEHCPKLQHLTIQNYSLSEVPGSFLPRPGLSSLTLEYEVLDDSVILFLSFFSNLREAHLRSVGNRTIRCNPQDKADHCFAPGAGNEVLLPHLRILQCHTLFDDFGFSLPFLASTLRMPLLDDLSLHVNKAPSRTEILNLLEGNPGITRLDLDFRSRSPERFRVTVDRRTRFHDNRINRFKTIFDDEEDDLAGHAGEREDDDLGGEGDDDDDGSDSKSYYPSFPRAVRGNRVSDFRPTFLYEEYKDDVYAFLDERDEGQAYSGERAHDEVGAQGDFDHRSNNSNNNDDGFCITDLAAPGPHGVPLVPRLALLRLVSPAPSHQTGRKPTAMTFHEETLKQLMLLVERRAELGYPLHQLSISPRMAKEHVEWFGERLCLWNITLDRGDEVVGSQWTDTLNGCRVYRR